VRENAKGGIDARCAAIAVVKPCCHRPTLPLPVLPASSTHQEPHLITTPWLSTPMRGCSNRASRACFHCCRMSQNGPREAEIAAARELIAKNLSATSLHCEAETPPNVRGALLPFAFMRAMGGWTYAAAT